MVHCFGWQNQQYSSLDHSTKMLGNRLVSSVKKISIFKFQSGNSSSIEQAHFSNFIKVFYMKRIQIIFFLMMVGYDAGHCQTTLQSHELLEALFLQPPDSVKPFAWWHWMGPNFSKQGITEDLEAMKEEGIGGATIFNLTSAVQESHAPTLNNPWPEQTYRSPAYWDALKFASSEAKRLGLEIGLHNTVGYSTTGGPWIDEARSMQHLVWSDTTITSSASRPIQLKAPELIADEGWGKTGRKLHYYKDLFVLAVPAGKNKIALEEVINLTAQYDSLNGLRWDVPAGRWTIYRIGHASTGRPPHPVPDDLLGKVLEADKMSVEQSTFHWHQVIEPVKEHLGSYVGNSFKHMLIDSYEAGEQNWTEHFRQEFIKRKGYDPVPWLASFSRTVSGSKNSNDFRIVQNEEQTRRFDWDYRDVIDQLYFENGWNIGKKLLKEANLDLQFEPYGGPFNTPQGVALADIPLAEFWTANVGGINPLVPAAARSAGKKVVGAESFTGRPEFSKYTEDPAFLKSTADKAFAAGINRLVLHHWVHQPFDDKYQPGMGMGWWGTHFGRYQTWFGPGKAFFTYLARCQALLQYGEQPAPYLCLDRVVGFSDVISKNDFLTGDISVMNGRIVLPSGRSYAFMVFPDDGVMLPEVARKIELLVSEGATIVSTTPDHSPSLKNFPNCDEEVKMIAKEVWGNGPSNKYKKGFVYTSLDDAVKNANIQPDFKIEKASSPQDIKMVHRHAPDADIYLVSNQSDKKQLLSLSFNISGKQPELWQAEDGTIVQAPVWEDNGKRSTIELTLKGTQTVFVVFRQAPSKADHPAALTVNDSTIDVSLQTLPNGQPVFLASAPVKATVDYASGKKRSIQTGPVSRMELTGSWKVTFVPKVDQPFEMDFPALVDFSKHESKAVSYFAGTAFYHKTFQYHQDSHKYPQKVVLDLGVMNDIASVTINGKDMGVLWYPPYTVDVTEAIEEGDNELEIAVTNNWANRLIGDEQEPADFEWGKDRGKSMGRAMLAYPDWFIHNEPRPSTGRKAFTIWYYYRKDSPLQPAGLVGPVQVLTYHAVYL